MTLGMPSITITFRQLAATAVRRSARGILAVVVKDATAGTVDPAGYTTYLDVPEDAFTADNYKLIKSCFTAAPSKVYIIKLGASATTAQLKTALDAVTFNWAVYLSQAKTDQEALVAYVKNRNTTKEGHRSKALVYGADVTVDDMHVVRFVTTSAKWEGATVAGWQLLGRLGGLLAGLPMTRSATYYELTDVSDVVEPDDLDAEVDKGNLFLFNDEGKTRIARAVNSLHELTANVTEDMKSIAIVEAMDLIQEDIYETFKNDYLGKYKNSYDNQALFIAAVNGYFKDLQKEEILDPNYANIASVDVAAQRDAWLANGTKEAAEWDELTIKNNTFKRKVFLGAKVKILDAMEDLIFPITMQ